MAELTEFEYSVHNCTKCKVAELDDIIQYYPVFSFGNPQNKPLLVVGLNPSTWEYSSNFLSSSKYPVIRHKSQMNYFNNLRDENKKIYTFFKNLAKLFNEDAKLALNWLNTPWEKVGFIDMVKCPTRYNDGQWTSIKPESRQKKIISNCENYLIKQLEILKPKTIMAYGADVCRWFYPSYKDSNDRFTAINREINNQITTIILVPQTHGRHAEKDIEKIQKKVKEVITNTN